MHDNNTIDLMPRMAKLKDAASQTGFSYYYLRNLCLEGKVKHIRNGNKIYINMGSLADYLNGELAK